MSEMLSMLMFDEPSDARCHDAVCLSARLMSELMRCERNDIRAVDTPTAKMLRYADEPHERSYVSRVMPR